MERKKLLITAALPYANGSIHIGHLLEYIQADVITRFLRLTGNDVIFLCASDTHGTPIEVNAAKMGMTPQTMVQKFNEEHKRDFESYLVQFDDFYTTHSDENKELSEFFFETLKKKGYIYTKKIHVIYCPSCSRTLPDRYVRGTCPHCTTKDQYGDICENCGVVLKGIELVDPKCSICATTPIQKEREHYFFKLRSFEKELREWLSNKNLQQEIVNHITGWLDKGLEDWCISRDGPYFGFLIPGETEKYFYVWLDAPIGYVATTKHFTDDWKDYWTGDGQYMHFIGKDIIYFHFLFWPAMLMGVGFNLPERIVVHGFLTVNGEKMSKSRGTFFTARDFLKLYEPEFLRFYYAQHLSEKLADVNLDFEDFEFVINNTLIGNVANFCYRVLSFIAKEYNGEIENITDSGFFKEIELRAERIAECYEHFDVRHASSEILALCDAGNAFFQAVEPWKNKEASKNAVGVAANIVRTLSIVISPILPRFAERIQQQMSEKPLRWSDIRFVSSIIVSNAEIVLRKIEKKSKPLEFPLDLRVGKVVSVEHHSNAEQLYIVQLDMGNERRQLVAGLRKYYTPEQLEGKHVVVCTNLKPAKIRGVTSQGMMLAADDAERVVVLEAAQTTPGEKVTMHGFENGRKQVTIEDFGKLGLRVVDGKVVWNKAHLHTPVEDIVVNGVENGAMVR
ncbi:MAG TPA: methionine--tRNA ligase [Candidatus Nanoarchaeia archaeon]|nr:methionine--tRNA ligase [Candidatus Nanoarchaeia archaeon]